MSCYGSLAAWYDQLTGDVPYAEFADFYEAEFSRCGGEFRLLLDLCCGTGTLTCEMARRGYELIGADASVDMLMQAQNKAAGLPQPPLFLCQQAEELDLYGTVDCAFCSLDGMNYLPPPSLPEVFRRLHLLFARVVFSFSISACRNGSALWMGRCSWMKGRMCSASGGRDYSRRVGGHDIRHGYLFPKGQTLGAEPGGACGIHPLARRAESPS